MYGFYLLKKGKEVIYEGPDWKQVTQALKSVQAPQQGTDLDEYLLSAIVVEDHKANIVYRKYLKYASGLIVNDGGPEIRGMPLKDLEHLVDELSKSPSNIKT